MQSYMVTHKKPIKFTKILTIKKYKVASYKILSDELELNFIFNNKINYSYLIKNIH